MPLLPQPQRTRGPMRQLWKGPRPERPHQPTLRPRSLDPDPERVGALVLRPSQTLRTASKVHRDKSQFSRKRTKLQPGLDQRRPQAPLTNPRQRLGHTCTIQGSQGKDHLRLDGSRPRIRFRNKGMGGKKEATFLMEEILVRSTK